MNTGYYRHYKELMARREELLTKLEELITGHPIQETNQLQALLSDADMDVDISTISRELQGLGIKNTSDGRYMLPDIQEMERKRRQVKEIFKQFVEDFADGVPTVVTLKTGHGHEESVALAIEKNFEERILGTVIGQGIVLVFAKDDNVGNEALRDIRQQAQMN